MNKTTLLHQQLDHLSRKLRQIEQHDREQPLSSARLTVLRMVKQNNPITLKELAQKQSVALPTMSKIVDELQKRNLIIRAQSKEDARKRWIVPTQKGVQELQKAEAKNQIFWQNKLDKLQPEQRVQLSESLSLLLETL